MHWSKVIGIAGSGGLVSCTVFAWILLATGDTAPLLIPMLATSCLLCVGAVVGAIWRMEADFCPDRAAQRHDRGAFAPIDETEV